MIDLGAAFISTEDGRMISAKIMRIAELISQYDPALEVRWIPPDKRDDINDPDSPHFQIIERRNGKEYICTYVKNESEFDERVLQQIFKWDASRSGNRLEDLEARNMAVQVLRAKEQADLAEERREFVISVLKSPLHAFRHGGKRFDLPGAPAEDRSVTIL